MDRVAVFVDAGYLYAGGSTALAGSKRPRSDLILDIPAIMELLEKIALDKSEGRPLLRIYWYDGLMASGPTMEQTMLAGTENVKLRLGVVNREGQQKGVDSLIVADLIALARNQAISDALLVSGDEDVRIGVEVAQGYGVRTHLVGIEPASASQSKTLRQESDTNTEIKQDDVENFLSIRETDWSSMEENSTKPVDPDRIDHDVIEFSIDNFVDSLDRADISRIASFMESESGVPREYDRRLLASTGRELGRDLTPEERKHMRRRFAHRIRER